jgi:pyrroloquinoline quinone biosynthesis protein E
VTEGAPLPPRLSIELTARCNFACPFCYGVWHERSEWGGPELPTAEWAAILADCARRGVRSVQFTGGEPLLREDLDELCDRALAAGLKVAVYTNASLLTEERLLSFRRRGVRLSTSLQGIKSHAEMTGTDRGPWPTLESVERAREIGWAMGVGVPLTRKNAFEAADIVAAALLAGASAVQVGPAMWEGRMKARTEEMLSAEEWTAIKETIRAVPSGKGKILFSEEFFCACREQPGDAAAKWPAPPKNCPAGKAFGVLGVNDRFRRCLHALS